MSRIAFDQYEFHPVVRLPKDYEVLDFTQGVPSRKSKAEYSIGRYNEERPGMYTDELFSDNRFIHMGVDIGAPEGTACYAVYEGEIFEFGDNQKRGDYGATIITRHVFDGVDLYILYGHLSKNSLVAKSRGQRLERGEVLAWIGGEAENGGWPPHLHFQLSYEAPVGPDLPGVVSPEMREAALEQFPDPQKVLGRLY